MHWSLPPRIETIKSSTYFTLSKSARNGVSANNFSSRSPTGIYSLKSLLAYTAISSRRTHMFSYSLIRILKLFFGPSVFWIVRFRLWCWKRLPFSWFLSFLFVFGGWLIVFSLPEFSLTHIYDSQDSRGKGGLFP